MERRGFVRVLADLICGEKRMPDFVIFSHWEFFSVRWHKVSDKRYWERILSCGQPAEPGTFLGTEISRWQ